MDNFNNIEFKKDEDEICAFIENKIYNKHSKIYMVADKNVHKIYNGIIDKISLKFNIKVFFIEASEENKNNETVLNIYNFLIENNATRNSALIALGGGITGDITGFVAATFMRGVPFFSIPTTLLSMVDSSVGGKVGYNFNKLKNCIGAFYAADFIHINTCFIKTLPSKEIKNGLGEIIKYGLIKDYSIISELEEIKDEFTSSSLENIIKKCVAAKLSYVNMDFKDTGIRNVLNFGHTIGHAIEVASNYEVSHGIAVALGMLVELKISQYKLDCSEEIYNRLLKLYKKLNIQTDYKVHNYENFFYAIKHDKKNVEYINMALIEKPEKPKINNEVKLELIDKALKSSIDRGGK